ncbi:UDP-N-acetylmuramate dehydrogenase [Pseudidiomarina planktonica]|uniref:UDP-N-acetylenolpyruvoylglucosamine reductase n=1 Tax=Pseudidiomarina planktonica TaxID=1323738 RepID=A0A1Y6FY26_9GAMM|nr:UDP-N-acetylmuramate dehydrogenase [Pseudidiomarina planktonica]RUO62942.1 UDP-N-acetylmuramate dehydrogenase [Pseudidiomarina planktonica]SMQ80838.1 UDP-N-acetylmuramate dehydrogenase [Pseudidiomarina planktonica]
MKLHTQHSVPLAPLHTFRIEVSGRSLIRLEDARQCLDLPVAEDYYVLGGGSNTLFTSDFGTLIVKNELRGIAIEEASDGFSLSVGAGENWHELVTNCLARGINGFENLALIPGTVGAAPVQNIGAYGVEIERYIETVEVWDRTNLEFKTFTKSDCQFAYRSSVFKQNPQRYIITKVNFWLPKNWQPELSYGPLSHLPKTASATDIAAQVIAIRQAKLPDPQELPNAGSFFKNPSLAAADAETLAVKYPALPMFPQVDGTIKLAAGWLIDHLQLKGYAEGAAAVHQNQALVLVNTGNAAGTDVIALAQHIMERVEQEYGVLLEPEVRILDSHGLLTI